MVWEDNAGRGILRGWRRGSPLHRSITSYQLAPPDPTTFFKNKWLPVFLVSRALTQYHSISTLLLVRMMVFKKQIGVACLTSPNVLATFPSNYLLYGFVSILLGKEVKVCRKL